MHYFCIFKIIRPNNLKRVAGIVVAKWTFALWFHAESMEDENNISILKTYIAHELYDILQVFMDLDKKTVNLTL